MPEQFTYDCPVCDGEGCTECGETGKRVTTWLELDGGIKMRVQGNTILTEADKAALAELGRAACERLDEKLVHGSSEAGE